MKMLSGRLSTKNAKARCRAGVLVLRSRLLVFAVLLAVVGSTGLGSPATAKPANPARPDRHPERTRLRPFG